MPTQIPYLDVKAAVWTRSHKLTATPAYTRRSPDVGSMLAHRRRRWASIEPTSGERLVYAGTVHDPADFHSVCPLSLPIDYTATLVK